MSFYRSSQELLRNFNNVKYILGLVVIPGLGRKRIFNLFNRFSSFKAIWKANKKDLRDIKRISTEIIDHILAGPNKKQIEILIERIEQLNIWIFINDGKNFPPLLSSISDPPFLIFGQGDYKLLRSPGIAIVGSRNATSYGEKIAFDIAHGLSKQSITVISGLARGIDTQAHKGAIAAREGKTIAVLGCGLGFNYPKSNLDIRKRIIEKGAIITEFLPDVKPNPGNFPTRNRIISGLSLGVVVVEASKKSGSLITASHALEQGREVFAVPGNVYSYKSSGTHWLIKQGAYLVENAKDILDNISSFNYSYQELKHNDLLTINQKKLQLNKLGALSSDEKRLYEALEPYSQHIDDLSNKINMPVSKVGALLTQLELKDLIVSLHGQMYQLK